MNENDDVHFECERKTVKKTSNVMSENEREKATFYIRSVFAFFTFLWALVILINGLHKNIAFIVLLIPFILFSIGFMNAYDISDDEIEEDVFSTTFITGGLVIFMALLTFYNKDINDKFLSHILYMAILFTLLSYYHIWVDKLDRHICKIIRSCFEVCAITLYIYTLTVYFIVYESHLKAKC